MRFAPLVAAIAAALLLLPPAAPAAAHPVPHGDAPQIVNARPSAGDVITPGDVTVAALVASNRAIERHELRIDGVTVPSTSTGGDHPTIAATRRLEAGLHTVELRVANAAGEAARTWRFRVDDMPVGRLSGTGRLETAVAISQDLYPEQGSAAAAVLARADDFPDALAGGPLAKAVDAPLLLSGREDLHPATAAELRRVVPAGATVYLLGGEAALGPRVLAAVRDLGLQPQRVSGPSRFATAAAIADLIDAEDQPAAVVASGEAFADALAVSVPAARDGLPILLSSRGALPAETRQAIAGRGVEHVVLVGGTGAVDAGVQRQLEAIGGVRRVERIAGATRFDTAAAIGARFYPQADMVALASGLAFPDALAGGRHAAERDAPLLLVDTQRMIDPQANQVARLDPSRGVVYGGSAAVGGGAVADLRRARVSAGGPVITGMTPGGGEVPTLDEVVITFDRDVQVAASDVQVMVGGDEAPGTLRHGEFANELVYAIRALPESVQPRTAYPVNVTVSAAAGDTVRAAHRRFTLRQPPATLSRGDSGAEVADLQRRLRDAGFWVGTIDGSYGTLTHQAVMALQKTHGLGRDGVYGAATRAVLESGPARPSARSGPGSGRVYEVDLTRQILLFVVDGQVQWVINASSGHGRVYEFNGQTYRANTTTGRHRIVRQIDGLREAERGKLWRPKYYDNARGIAIHGSTSVPATPESSGCIRVTYAAMDFLWSLDPGTGAGVWVYPEGYYG